MDIGSALSGRTSRTRPVADDYFDGLMLNRQRLFWTVAIDDN